jgi:threonine/homoserine efflux transporter RhtA
VYFSLEYLSLSDATVITFIAPILTTFSGAIFLKETLSLNEVGAGGMCFQAETKDSFLQFTVSHFAASLALSS